MKSVVRMLFRPLVIRDIRVIIREIGDFRHPFRETPKNELIKFHHMLGMSLRNNFRGGRFRALFADSYRRVRERGEDQSFDSISSVALEQVWDELQKKRYARR